MKVFAAAVLILLSPVFMFFGLCVVAAVCETKTARRRRLLVDDIADDPIEICADGLSLEQALGLLTTAGEVYSDVEHGEDYRLWAKQIQAKGPR